MGSIKATRVYSDSGKPFPIRGFPVGAWDSDRKKFVIFGGTDKDDFNLAYKDTWEFDLETGAWIQRQPIVPATLTERNSGAGTYDSNRKRFVQFGGGAPGPAFTIFDETFEYDGTGEGQWFQIFPTTKPSPRLGSNMTFDSLRNVVVAFGGILDTFVLTNELWEYNGIDWSLKTPVTTGIYETPPDARYFHSIAYDPIRQLTVIIGGFDFVIGVTNEVWLWDGIGFRQQTVSEKPNDDHMVGGGAAYLRSEKMVVFFTGAENEDAPLASELWGIDENGWQRFHPIPVPQHKSGVMNVMGSDGVAVLMFDFQQRIGPVIGGTFVYTSELFTFDGLAHQEQRTGFEFDDTQIEIASGARLLDQP